MGILSFVTDTAGQGGINPRRLKLVTTDNLSSVTSAGYLNGEVFNGKIVNATDVIDAIYDYSKITNTGTYGCFLPSVVGGTVTLSTWAADPSIIIPPTFTNHIAVFSFPDGTKLEDSGFNIETDIIKVDGGNGQHIDSQDVASSIGVADALAVTQTLSATNVTGFSHSSGLRGVLKMKGADSGTFYGTRGYVNPRGSVTGTASFGGLYGELDLTSTVIPASTNMTAIYAHIGGSPAPTGVVPGMYGISLVNDSSAVTDAQVNLFGGALNLLNLDDNGSLITYFATAGTSSGSAGDTTKCNASKVLKIKVNSTDYWIPLFASNS